MYSMLHGTMEAQNAVCANVDKDKESKSDPRSLALYSTFLARKLCFFDIVSVSD